MWKNKTTCRYKYFGVKLEIIIFEKIKINGNRIRQSKFF